jgi:hypothetical protein
MKEQPQEKELNDYILVYNKPIKENIAAVNTTTTTDSKLCISSQTKLTKITFRELSAAITQL